MALDEQAAGQFLYRHHFFKAEGVTRMGGWGLSLRITMLTLC